MLADFFVWWIEKKTVLEQTLCCGKKPLEADICKGRTLSLQDFDEGNLYVTAFSSSASCVSTGS